MRPADLAYETVLSFKSNVARSLLTILGIVIGISAVVAMTSLIGGIRQTLMGNLGLDQARLINVSCYYNGGMRLSDVEAMQNDLGDDFDYLTPSASGYADSITSGKEKKSGSVTGVEEEYCKAMNLKLMQGRFLNEGECERGSMSVVIDQASVRQLFGNPNENVVGRKIKIGNNDYEIVGVVEAGSQSFGDMVQVYMPTRTCMSRLNGDDSVSTILAFAHEGADVNAEATKLKEWLVKHFNVPDDQVDDYVWVQTMQSLIDEVNQTISTFQALMVTVASVSLLVGGIGIMNMMLTNVTERIREIGLRKALGAKRADITSQFLLESVVLCLAGGVLGVLLGIGGSYLLTGLMGSFAEQMSGSTEFTPVIDPTAVLFATVVCVGIGVLFGYYPARRAAKLDPVESLHYQ